MWFEIFEAGIDSLLEYLSLHVLTCLVPAFFISGAIAALLSQNAVLKYFGADAKKLVSYGVASISGTVLAVCSCTVLPMFAGIYKKGAGIGPATAFLFSGPAINILAIVLTARVLGLDIGVARSASAVIMAVVVGLIMASIFERGNRNANEGRATSPADSVEAHPERPWYVTLLFFGLLITILIVVSSGEIPAAIRAILACLMTAGVVILALHYYSGDETRDWMNETWWLTKKIFPVLLVGVFIIGMIGGIAAIYAPSHNPQTAVGEIMKPYLGDSSFLSCLLASVIGAVLYMPTLLEVPIVGGLFGYTAGLMSPGAALSLLLAGPSLSLPNMIVLWSVIGARKTGVYVALVIVISTVIGVIFGGMKTLW